LRTHGIKDKHPMKILNYALLSLFVISISLSNSNAQVIFTSELDSDTGWTIVADEDTSYEFGFDYTTLGIPANPNSSATSTTGLKMSANITSGVASAIAATPDGVSVSGDYQFKTDFWLNFNTSGGTTEFIGAYVGYDASSAPLNGVGMLGDSDGDSASDYRIYSDAGVAAGTNQVSSLDNADEAVAAAFPGQEVPAAQGDATLFDPANTIVTAADGTLGFAWHTLTIDVNGGMADLSINGFSLGTVDATADPAALEGGVALAFADLFSSVSTKPEFSFGVFDNVSVSQVPEPNGFLMGGFGLLVIGVMRRRRCN